MNKKLIIHISIPALAFVLTLCSQKKVNEIEPNNSFSFANEIISGSSFYGTIESKDDRDFYKITITEESILDISLSGVKGINHAVKVWHDDDPPRIIKIIDDTRKSSPERMVNLHVLPGNYFISVEHGERDRKKGNTEITYRLALEQRAPSVEETEPNDSLLTACPAEETGLITGFYSPSYNRLNLDKEFTYREEDWYYLTVSASLKLPQMLNVSISGVYDINTQLFLYDEAGELIIESDNNLKGQGESIENIGINEPGRYYIMVCSKGYTSNNDIPYTLSYTLEKSDNSSELETNNSFDNANIFYFDSISGKINSTRDIDFFLYQYSRGSFFRVEAVPTDDLDIELTIYSYERKNLIEVNNGKKGEKEIYPNLAITDNFYCVVQSRLLSESSDLSYTVSVLPFTVDGAMEIEPNNNTENATHVAENEIAGFSSFHDDTDYFEIREKTRIRKEIEITGNKNGACTMSITDPLGYVIKSVSVSGDEKASVVEMIDKKGYIIIQHKKPDYDNPYYITLKDAP